ncbi:MAG: phosphotransferase [Verrucomicrobiota bacterium]
MPSAVATILTGLFAPGSPAGRPVTLEWCLMTRRGRPLLLLPRSYRAARQGMELYAAQRPLAKVARKLLPFALQSPFRGLLPKVGVSTNTTNDLLKFLATEAALPPEHLPAPAILLGNQPADNQRFVLLLLNAQTQPIAVVKCGLTPAAQRVVEREARMLASLPTGLPGGLPLSHRLTSPTLSAFAVPYRPGTPPHDTAPRSEILNAWLHSGPLVPLHSLPTWQTLANRCGADNLFLTLNATVGSHLVRPAIHHGDFAPWNIRVNAAGQWMVVDWERGELNGVPGWDWFHYVIQTALLVERVSGTALLEKVEAAMQETDFAQYAEAANIRSICRPLLLAYLLHQNEIIRPGESRETGLALQEQLARIWQLAR